MRIYSKTVPGKTLQIFFLLLLSVYTGCKPALTASRTPHGADKEYNTSVHTHYTPAKINIMPLTGFVVAPDNNTEKRSNIKVYVSLLDQFGCQMKTFGVFRFELYQYIQLSAEPKGRRLVIWPDINLTDAAENNKYWLDFLRVYKFNLDFEPEGDKSYILQVTCLCPNGERLSSESCLKPTQ